jgi:hypothetical protein
MFCLNDATLLVEHKDCIFLVIFRPRNSVNAGWYEFFFGCGCLRLRDLCQRNFVIMLTQRNLIRVCW